MVTRTELSKRTSIRQLPRQVTQQLATPTPRPEELEQVQTQTRQLSEKEKKDRERAIYEIERQLAGGEGVQLSGNDPAYAEMQRILKENPNIARGIDQAMATRVDAREFRKFLTTQEGQKYLERFTTEDITPSEVSPVIKQSKVSKGAEVFDITDKSIRFTPSGVQSVIVKDSQDNLRSVDNLGRFKSITEPRYDLTTKEGWEEFTKKEDKPPMSMQKDFPKSILLLPNIQRDIPQQRTSTPAGLDLPITRETDINQVSRSEIKRRSKEAQGLREDLEDINKRIDKLSKGDVNEFGEFIGTTEEYAEYSKLFNEFDIKSKKLEDISTLKGGLSIFSTDIDISRKEFAGGGFFGGVVREVNILTGTTGGFFGGLSREGAKLVSTEDKPLKLSKEIDIMREKLPYEIRGTQTYEYNALLRELQPTSRFEADKVKVGFDITPSGAERVGQTIGEVSPYIVAPSLFFAEVGAKGGQEIFDKGLILGTKSFVKEYPLEAVGVATLGLARSSKYLFGSQFKVVPIKAPRLPEVAQSKVGLLPIQRVVRTPKGEILEQPFIGFGVSGQSTGGRMTIRTTRFREFLGLKPKYAGSPTGGTILRTRYDPFKGSFFERIDVSRATAQKDYKKALKFLVEKRGLIEKEARNLLRRVSPKAELSTSQVTGKVVVSEEGGLNVFLMGKRKDVPFRYPNLIDIGTGRKTLTISRGGKIQQTRVAESLEEVGEKGQFSIYRGFSGEFNSLGKLGKRQRYFEEGVVSKQVSERVLPNELGKLEKFRIAQASKDITTLKKTQPVIGFSESTVVSPRVRFVQEVDSITGKSFIRRLDEEDLIKITESPQLKQLEHLKKLSNRDNVILYHGTTKESSRKILESGLKPAKEVGISRGLPIKLPEVYATPDLSRAKGWAGRAFIGKGKPSGGGTAVLEINLPKKEFNKLLIRRSIEKGGGEEVVLKKIPKKYIKEYKPPEIKVVEPVKQVESATQDISQVLGTPQKQKLIEKTPKLISTKISSVTKPKKIKPTPKVSEETLLKTEDLATTPFARIGGGTTRFELDTVQVTIQDLDRVEKPVVIESARVTTKEETSTAEVLNNIGRMDTGLKFNVRDLVKEKQEIGLKQPLAQRQIQQQTQIQDMVLKTGLKFKTEVIKSPKPPKTPTKIIPPILFSQEPTRKTAKEKVNELFKVFARKKGQDIKIGEFESLGKAKDVLTKELKSTLRASGFISKGEEKLKAEELNLFGGEFTPSKVDIFRVVQKRGKRLGTTSEVFEIQRAKKSSPRKKRGKPIKWV